MTDYQKAEVKMLQEVVNFFDNNPELEKGDEMLKKHVDLLREKLKELKENEIKQNYNNTGYTENKKVVKNDLADISVNVTSSICSYATDSGKNELYNEFKTPISKVQVMSDSDIIIYSDKILVESEKYKKELEPYHVTAEDLVNLTKLNEEYSKILLVPAEERKEKAVATANIKTLIPESLQILKRSLDRDMIHYKDTQPDLYETYKNMREIDDSQTTALSIKGTVTEVHTQAHEAAHVLQYVKVTVKFKAGSELSDKVKSTTAKGNYQFKGIPEGKCTLTFELEYYDTVIVESVVYSDKATKLNIEMKKSIKL